MKNQQLTSRRAMRHRKKNRRRVQRWTGAVLALSLLGGSGVIAFDNLTSKIQTADASQYMQKHDRPKKITKNRKPSAPEDTFDGALNVLLIGSDSRGNSGDTNVEGMRSDTTVLAHISADRERVDMISIPRDSLVQIPSCTLPNGSQTAPTVGKFNAAFSIGGQTGDTAAAAACTTKTFENLTNVYVDGFAVVDFKGFKNVINSLGGVEFTVEQDIVDPSFGNLVIEAGTQTFDGETALKYARVRKAIGMDGSDLSRIDRQQELMSAIVEKAKSEMTNIPAMYSMVESIAEMTVTSPELGNVSKLAGLAWSLKDTSKEDINFVTVPVTDAGDGSNVLWTLEAQNLWHNVRVDEPVIEESSQNTEKTNPDVPTAEDVLPGRYFNH